MDELLLLRMITGKTTATAIATTITPITRGFVCQGKPLSGGLELSVGLGEAIGVDEGLKVATGVLDGEGIGLGGMLAEGVGVDKCEVGEAFELGIELAVDVGDWVGVGVGRVELILLFIAYLAALMIIPLVLSLTFVIVRPFSSTPSIYPLLVYKEGIMALTMFWV